MGGRYIIVQDGAEDTRIYLYTQWGGSQIAFVLQTALKRRARWDDAPYLTRIIFDALTDGRQGQETGFGISTKICDNDNPGLLVDVTSEIVAVLPMCGRGFGDVPVQTATFEEFCKLANPSEWLERAS